MNADTRSQRQTSQGSIGMNPNSASAGAAAAAADSGGGSGNSVSSENTFFLDGRFAGGWQSNADLPERRRVIFNILEVIRQMRPETSKLSNK
jgi:hypothetical protein